MVTSDEYRRAERELMLAEATRGWRVHAAVYAVVMTGLIVLNALLIAFTDGTFPWVVFPLVGWGIGLGFHYVAGVRRAERSIRVRQDEIEERARQLHLAA